VVDALPDQTPQYTQQGCDLQRVWSISALVHWPLVIAAGTLEHFIISRFQWPLVIAAGTLERFLTSKFQWLLVIAAGTLERFLTSKFQFIGCS
jgi:hypothetical protein